MDKDSGNEGSSPDTVIARSSYEDDQKSQEINTSGEYVTVAESSSTSLDPIISDVAESGLSVGSSGIGSAVVGVVEEKKKGRFETLKSTFRKDGGIFKIKKKKSFESEPSIEVDMDENESTKGLLAIKI